MVIFNIMLSKELGGIQQAFLDYDKALKMKGCKVVNITSLASPINNLISSDHKLLNIFPLRWLAKIYLLMLAHIYKPSAIIAHGGRAVEFARLCKSKKVPLVGVAHNYKHNRLKKCDYIFAITNEMKKFLLNNGVKEEKIFVISNMIKVQSPYTPRKFNSPVVIGSFGRFVKKKGFDYLIKSIPFLKEQGHKVKLMLGGSGEEESNLKKLVRDFGLEIDVTFTGWVHDKKTFFESIDIFCLPSTAEPFGIILLEAMEYSTPIISTNIEGPGEILQDNKTALLVQPHSSEDISDKISSLIMHQEQAPILTENAFNHLKNHYDISVVSQKLFDTLNIIIHSKNL